MPISGCEAGATRRRPGRRRQGRGRQPRSDRRRCQRHGRTTATGRRTSPGPTNPPRRPSPPRCDRRAERVGVPARRAPRRPPGPRRTGTAVPAPACRPHRHTKARTRRSSADPRRPPRTGRRATGRPSRWPTCSHPAAGVSAAIGGASSRPERRGRKWGPPGHAAARPVTTAGPAPGAAAVDARPKRRRRKALVTTDTEEKAMARAAKIGGMIPKAARGTRTRL